MILVGLIICFLLGFGIVSATGMRLSKVESIGLSMLLGLAGQSFLMLILDALGVPLTATTSSIAAILVASGLLYFAYKRYGKFFEQYNFKLEWRGLNIVWLLAMVLVCYVEYMNWSKTIYFPPFDRDSLAGFETIGYVIAREGCFANISLFDSAYMPSISAAGSYITYAPMVQLCYGWAYMWGAESSKIIPAVIYLAFLVSMYGVVRRVSSDMTAALTLVFVLLTPEMIAFSSLSATNVMHAVYASIGVIYCLRWFKERDFSVLVLGSLMLSANVWIRSEGVVFIMGVGALMLIDAFKSKRWMELWYMVGIAATPMVAWGLFCSAFGLESESVTIFQLFFDGDKASKIYNYFYELITADTYYGYTFVAFGLAILASGYYIIRRRTDWRAPLVVVLSLVLYALMLYQIDYKWDTLDNVLAYSAKRFFFCFVPICWYYVATCTPVNTLLGKINKALTF